MRWRQSTTIWVAFHSTKFPEIPVQNWMKKKFSGNSFRKFQLTSRGCPFFLKMWKFQKFPVPFGISTRFELAPVRLVMKSYKMAASLSSRHYTRCKMICHSASLFLIENEIVRIWFPGKLRTGRSEFPVGQEELNSVNSECVFNFSTWSSLIQDLRKPLHHDPSAFSRVILCGKCAQAETERDRSGLVENAGCFPLCQTNRSEISGNTWGK